MDIGKSEPSLHKKESPNPNFSCYQEFLKGHPTWIGSLARCFRGNLKRACILEAMFEAVLLNGYFHKM